MNDTGFPRESFFIGAGIGEEVLETPPPLVPVTPPEPLVPLGRALPLEPVPIRTCRGAS